MKEQNLDGEFDTNQDVTKKITNKSQLFQQYVMVPPDVDEDDIGEGEGEEEGDSDNDDGDVKRKSTNRLSKLKKDSSGLIDNL